MIFPGLSNENEPAFLCYRVFAGEVGEIATIREYRVAQSRLAVTDVTSICFGSM